MGRYALIRDDGSVYNVIVATSDVATMIADEVGCTSREIVTELEEPETENPIVSRSCEPGAIWKERDATVAERTRARRDGARYVVEDFDRAPVSVEPAPQDPPAEDARAKTR